MTLVAPLAPADSLATAFDLPTFDMPVSGDSLVKLGLRDRAPEPRLWDRVSTPSYESRIRRMTHAEVAGVAPVSARSAADRLTA